MFNKKCGEIISFMPIFFVKQSLLFFNSCREVHHKSDIAAKVLSLHRLNRSADTDVWCV